MACDAFAGINSYKVWTMIFGAIAIGLMAPVYGHSLYETCYLAFLCTALIITFLYILLIVVLKLIPESGTVIILDKAYHVIMFILLVAGWGLYVACLVDWENSFGSDYDRQMALRICSIIFSGFEWLLFIDIIFVLFH